MSDLENGSFRELEQRLPSFICEARRQEGKPYPPNTLYLLMCGVQRHLREIRSDGLNVNLVDIKSTDARFCCTVKVLDATMKELTRQSLGIKRIENKRDVLTFADELSL